MVESTEIGVNVCSFYLATVKTNGIHSEYTTNDIFMHSTRSEGKKTTTFWYRHLAHLYNATLLYTGCDGIVCALFGGETRKNAQSYEWKCGLEKQRIERMTYVVCVEAQREWVKMFILFYLFVWLCVVGSLLTLCIFIVSNICSIYFILVEFLVRAQPIQPDSRLFRSFASIVKQHMIFTQCFVIFEMYFYWINTWRLTDCLLFGCFNSRITSDKKKDFILRKYFDQLKDKRNWTNKILLIQNQYEHWLHSNESINN